jgi:hypothetical protein
MNLLKKCRYGLFIYNTKDIWVGRSLEKYGEFSEAEVQVFSRCINPGAVILDIGANIGCHTIALARLTGPAGMVFAYEPERTNFVTLCGKVITHCRPFTKPPLFSGPAQINTTGLDFLVESR